MNKQISLPDSAIAEPQGSWKHSEEVFHDIACQRIKIVNVVFLGEAGESGWVLVDTGMGDAADAIREAAKERFGEHARPAAIIQTHAHFDHIGAVKKLAEEWDVPVFAHPLERPYLDGTTCYPPPDAHAGGGLMTRLSPLFPREPIDLGALLNLLPSTGDVPALSGWRWLHTPGHTPGHISLWRESDRALIAGDAFVTTRQESVYAAMTQKPEMHGPPMYYTQNFSDAEASVQKLASLEPELAITGHGKAMRGPAMRKALFELARNFKKAAVPDHGKYVENP